MIEKWIINNNLKSHSRHIMSRIHAIIIRETAKKRKKKECITNALIEGKIKFKKHLINPKEGRKGTKIKQK